MNDNDVNWTDPSNETDGPREAESPSGGAPTERTGGRDLRRAEIFQEWSARNASTSRSISERTEELPASATAGGVRRFVSRVVLLALIVATAAVAGGAGGGAVAWYLLHNTPINSSATLEARSDPVAEPISSTIVADVDEPYLDVVRQTRPAVVTVLNLRAMRALGGPITYEPYGSGSGVIFDERGYVATNYHVIMENQGLEVLFLDGTRATATVVGSDANFDVAILKLDAGVKVPAIAPLADSSLIEPGMSVMAIGSPLGTEYQNTVTTGIVAGMNRQLRQSRLEYSPFGGVQRTESLVNYAPLIQTDAAINSGNSGGPLINMRGEVIGLNTLVVRADGRASVEGLGLAVPSNVVRALADEWIDNLPRPYLGITFDTVTYETAQTYELDVSEGAVVGSVEPDSAARRGEIAEGDIIVAIDGIRLNADRALTDLLWRYRAGDEITLTVRRGEEVFDTRVELGSATGSTP